MFAFNGGSRQLLIYLLCIRTTTMQMTTDQKEVQWF